MPEARRTLAPLSQTVLASPAALLLIPAVATFVGISANGGGYATTTWLPATLFVIGLLLVGLLTLGQQVPLLVKVAVLALIAYAAWSYLSITWAGNKGQAWDGANRTLLFAATFSLFALWRVRARTAAAVLGLLAVGIAGIALVELLRAAAASNPRAFFLEGRFAAPVTYQNASAALWTLALWPSVVLASRREVPVWARSLLGASAVVLASAALLSQSRGWLFAVPITAIVMVVVTPQRLRLTLTFGLVALTGLVISRPLLDVYDAAGTPGYGTAVGNAVRAIVIAAAVVGAVVGIAASFDRSRPQPSPAVRRRIAVALLLAYLAAGALALGAFVARQGSPFTALADGWRTFKTEPSPSGAGSRFSQSLGSNRYDFWRVAVDIFEERPLAGVGADNFQQDYLERRHSSEEPLYPHSVELRALSQTGLVGTLVLLTSLGAAVAAAVLAIRRRNGLGAAVAAAGLTAFASWFIHGSVDWFWEFAGLGALAFAALGVAAGLLPRRPGSDGALVRGRPAVIAVSVCAVAAAASMVAPWLAQREIDAAAADWPQTRGEALHRLDDAARLNPLSPDPYLFAGTIAQRLGRDADAERYYTKAIERDPRSHYAHLELGMLVAADGRRARAVTYLARAAALNPRDDITRAVLARVRKGRRVNIDRVNRRLAERSEKVGR